MKSQTTAFGKGARGLALFGRWGWLRELSLLPVIILFFIVGTIVNSSFLTVQNIVWNILQMSSVLAVLVLAESLVLISGKFDLSLESTVALAPMVAAWLMTPVTMGGSGWGAGAVVGILVTLGLGVAIGFVNAMLIVKLRLNAFMATLAMLILLRGACLGVTEGRFLFDLPYAYIFMGSQPLAGVPASVWVAVVLYIAAAVLLKYHRYGKFVYSIGGNDEAARTAGVPVERVRIALFILAGLLAGLAGWMLSGRIAMATPNQGSGMIFSVFAAAVIGGVSLDGGRGGMIGAFLGVVLIGTVQNILTLSKIPSPWMDAVFGGIIVVAVLISGFTGKSETT